MCAEQQQDTHDVKHDSIPLSCCEGEDEKQDLENSENSEIYYCLLLISLCHNLHQYIIYLICTSFVRQIALSSHMKLRQLCFTLLVDYMSRRVLTHFCRESIYNMLRNYQPAPEDFSTLQLPSTLCQLLRVYQSEETQFVRICTLSHIKQIILSQLITSPNNSATDQESLPSPQFSPQSYIIAPPDPNNPNTIFSALFLRYLKRGQRNRSVPRSEVRLFYHVISLAIKCFYSQEQFRYLFNQITEVIENHKERIQTALEFFSEVIATVQYNYQSQNKGKCKFDRHFATGHLNSMVMIANFFMEKAVLRDGEAVQDGIVTQNFKLKVPEEYLLAIMQMLQRVICFDFIGEKFSEDQEREELSTIIIPTKNTKYANLSQFQKWIKNSQWIRLYQFLYHHCKLLPLKLAILDLLGDMARIHMKYFKNKNCFKVHIENIVYSFADLLQHHDPAQTSDSQLKLAIATGRNLLKLTSPAVVPILFQISPNLYAGLLENVKTFLIQQIFGEDVFNVNIIFYFFRFIANLQARCIFERSGQPGELIERVTRQICRNYENYLRILLRKVARGPPAENCAIRQDYSHLHESLQEYRIDQLMIYLSPFQFMKPRYTSIGSVQELFVLVCAKFRRAIYILETLPNHHRERDFAMQMIEKSIGQIGQWFAYTTYARQLSKPREEGSKNRLSSRFEDSFELNMESISEVYQEEIENQEEYCQVLRVNCFFMLDSLNKLPLLAFRDLNKTDEVFRLIRLTLLLCFQADLQEPATERITPAIRCIIQERLEQCLAILQKLFLKEWQYSIYLMNKDKVMRNHSYRFTTYEEEIQFLELADVKDHMQLLYTVSQIRSPFSQKNEMVNGSLRKIEYLMAYSISKQQKSQMTSLTRAQSIEDCLSFTSLISNNPPLATLLNLQEPILFSFSESIQLKLHEKSYPPQLIPR